MPENQKPQLDRFGVAAALQEIAQLMDLKGGQFRFKAKAYNAGAQHHARALPERCAAISAKCIGGELELFLDLLRGQRVESFQSFTRRWID